MLKTKALPIFFAVFSILSARDASANIRSSETIRAQKGLFRLMSADINEASAYHFRTSLEYFQQKDLLKDIDDSTIKDTKATLGFGYSLTPHIHLNAHGGFNIASSTPSPASTTATGGQSIDLIKAGAGVVGTYDIGEYLWNLPANRFTGGFSLWVDFSKITRFFAGPNIIPTFILSGDFVDNPVVPYRVHLNTGFRMANGARYYGKSSAVTDFDRFVTETINSPAVTVGTGVEFPFFTVTPSLELHMEKVMNTSFSNTPKWLTAGLKGKPFPQKNVEVFSAVDVGLSSFKATPLGQKPDSSPVPLWNVVVGFGIAQFGKRAGEVGVDQLEYDSVRNALTSKEKTLAQLQKDLEYNTLQGQVVDADTKKPISGVLISFPESTELKSSGTDDSGRFVRYFRTLPGARLLFSKDGYESSSKFVALKPGERLNVDIELKKSSGVSLAEFIATITDENGQGIETTITFTNLKTTETTVIRSDSNMGQVNMKIAEGSYRIEIKSTGFKTATDTIEFKKGKTVLRSYLLIRQGVVN